MLELVRTIGRSVVSMVKGRRNLALENLACRRVWSGWKSSLHSVQPATVDSPSGACTARQLLETLPFDPAPRFLIRDNDSIFSGEFSARVGALGIDEVRTAIRSPWQNSHCERLIGSIRLECLDHIIVLCEQHLRRVLRSCVDCYHSSRTHQSLANHCPSPLSVKPLEMGKVIAFPKVGGWHHQYARRIAA